MFHKMCSIALLALIPAMSWSQRISAFYAFVSYDDPTKVTFIMAVNPATQASEDPSLAPFGENLHFKINIDNSNSGNADIAFQFQFFDEFRTSSAIVPFLGAGNGVEAPANSPAPVAPGTLVIPAAITSMASTGLAFREHYTVTMIKEGVNQPLTSSNGDTLYAVPPNAGPRTMPNYPALAAQGVYALGNGIRVFAGSADDPEFADVGALFDTYNFFIGAGGGVLSAGQDADDFTNTASDSHSGFNVNVIAIEVPIALLTRTGTVLPATSPAATIGAWARLSRPQTLELHTHGAPSASGDYVQIDRMGNPYVRDFLIGLGARADWSQDDPGQDDTFKSAYSDPLLARHLNAIYGIAIPAPPRTDLKPLLTYAAPVAAPGTPHGPNADLLRLNTGIAPTAEPNRRRLGLLAGDLAGYPNGRRLSDDALDITLRAIAGVWAGSQFSYPLGDGVNINDVPFQETFPYVAWSQNARNRRHIDPGEPGCTQGAGAPCPIE
jgi:hypothetical protein